MKLEEFMTESLGSLSEDAPGYGGRYRGDDGEGIFTRNHIQQIGAMIAQEHGDNEVVRKALIDWFVNCFHADKPHAKPEAIRKMLESGGVRTTPRWQERHFYFLARKIKETTDRAMAEYICHWLSDLFSQFNENFRPGKWFQFCGVAVPEEHLDTVKRKRRRR